MSIAGYDSVPVFEEHAPGQSGGIILQRLLIDDLGQKFTLQSTMNDPAQQPTDAVADFDISVLAYRMWNQNGRPVGRFVEFWNEAAKLAKAKPTVNETNPSADTPRASRESGGVG